MPMHGWDITDESGRVIGRACGRGARYSKCKFCGKADANLECDGCDACSVAPTAKLDFCPECAKPAFEHWKANEGGLKTYQELGREVGRMQFRAWVKANRQKFYELARSRSAASLAAVPERKSR
jgi:hypothetical protein